MSAVIVPVWGQKDAPVGPVHLSNPGGVYGQAWCGARPQFRHSRWTAPTTDVTCPRCIKAMEAGRPMARGSRR